MAHRAEIEKRTGLAARFGAFVAERHPFALEDALAALDAAAAGREPRSEADVEALRAPLRRELARRLQARGAPAGLGETTPRVRAEERLAQAAAEVVDACDGFLRRQAIAASLT